MNVSLASLCLASLSTSPVFALPRQKLASQFSLRSCQAHKHFSSFLFGDSSLRYRIDKSRFALFLDTAIRIDALSVDGAEIRMHRVAKYDNVFKCTNSMFFDCQCSFGAGGAIFCVAETIFNNCLFDHCLSERGGAVYSGGNMDYTSVTFQKCIGFQHGGAVASNGPRRVSISFSTLSECASHTAGGLIIQNVGSSVFRYCNISACAAMESSGAMAINGDIFMNFLIVDQCYAGQGPAGINIIATQKFHIEFIMFALLMSEMSREDEGVCIASHNTLGNCSIVQSSIVATRKVSGYSIYVTGPPDQFELSISGCCFDREMAHELAVINGSLVERVPSVVLEDCQKFLVFMLPRKIGYLKDLSATPRPLVDQIFSRTVVSVLSRWMIHLASAGCAGGIVFWTVINCFGGKRKRSKKRRRALL